jgi:hypothetical protein
MATQPVQHLGTFLSLALAGTVALLALHHLSAHERTEVRSHVVSPALPSHAAEAATTTTCGRAVRFTIALIDDGTDVALVQTGWDSIHMVMSTDDVASAQLYIDAVNASRSACGLSPATVVDLRQNLGMRHYHEEVQQALLRLSQRV